MKLSLQRHGQSNTKKQNFYRLIKFENDYEGFKYLGCHVKIVYKCQNYKDRRTWEWTEGVIKYWYPKFRKFFIHYFEDKEHPEFTESQEKNFLWVETLRTSKTADDRGWFSFINNEIQLIKETPVWKHPSLFSQEEYEYWLKTHRNFAKPELSVDTQICPKCKESINTETNILKCFRCERSFHQDCLKPHELKGQPTFLSEYTLCEEAKLHRAFIRHVKKQQKQQFENEESLKRSCGNRDAPDFNETDNIRLAKRQRKAIDMKRIHKETTHFEERTLQTSKQNIASTKNAAANRNSKRSTSPWNTEDESAQAVHISSRSSFCSSDDSSSNSDNGTVTLNSLTTSKEVLVKAEPAVVEVVRNVIYNLNNINVSTSVIARSCKSALKESADINSKEKQWSWSISNLKQIILAIHPQIKREKLFVKKSAKKEETLLSQELLNLKTSNASNSVNVSEASDAKSLSSKLFRLKKPFDEKSRILSPWVCNDCFLCVYCCEPISQVLPVIHTKVCLFMKQHK